jgi:hypothetical protein
MRKGYISLAALTGVAFLGLVSCNDKKEDKKDTTTTSIVESTTDSTITSHFPTDTTTSTDAGTASLKVIDFDGEVVFDGEVQAGDTLYNVITSTQGIETVSSESQYGHFLQSINGTIMDDPNLYLMIYENDVMSNTGIDEVIVDDGDVFEIKNEFWKGGHYDDVDVLVDKTIYTYVKSVFKEATQNTTSFKGSTFWEYLLSDLAIKNGYDVSLFNVRDANDDLLEEVNNYDYSTIGYKDGVASEVTEFFKYYYTALGIGGFDVEIDSTDDKIADFEAALKTYADANITNEYAYNQYSSPFILSILNKLDVNKDTLKTIAQATNKLDIERSQWGNYTDQLVWQVLTFAAIQGNECKFDDTVLNSLNVRADEFNCTSLAASVAAFAALGENPRDEKYEIEGEDIIENIMTNFYDETSGLLKVNKNDETIPEFSTNQIYAYLFAYKISRDYQNESTGAFAKFNLFA